MTDLNVRLRGHCLPAAQIDNTDPCSNRFCASRQQSYCDDVRGDQIPHVNCQGGERHHENAEDCLYFVHLLKNCGCSMHFWALRVRVVHQVHSRAMIVVDEAGVGAEDSAVGGIVDLLVRFCCYPPRTSICLRLLLVFYCPCHYMAHSFVVGDGHRAAAAGDGPGIEIRDPSYVRNPYCRCDGIGYSIGCLDYYSVVDRRDHVDTHPHILCYLCLFVYYCRR